MASQDRKQLAIIGATGKLAAATLKSLLSQNLLPASSIVATTSATSETSPQWQSLSAQGVTVRHATFDSAESISTALRDVDKVLIVSSPRIALDYDNAPPGSGRENDHITAIDAARKAGVKHIYYTSLAFGRPSKAGVMRAHIATEEYLERGVKDVKWTVLREGLYNESWPLYFGHWKLGKDDREEVLVAGDGKLSWTSIADLGLATALVLVAPEEEYDGKTIYLSNTKDALSLQDIAVVVSEELSRDVIVKVIPRSQHEEHYIKERGEDEGHIKWWASSYAAVQDGETHIQDTLLETLLDSRSVKPQSMKDTIRAMLKQ